MWGTPNNAMAIGEGDMVGWEDPEPSCTKSDEIHSQATLDRFAGDQILPFTALAGQSTFRVPFVTEHLETGGWLASLFLGADVRATGTTVAVAGRDRRIG